MVEKPDKKFSNPEEEVSFLREQLAMKERDLLERSKGIDNHDSETIGKELLKEYSSFTPKMVLEKNTSMTDHEVHSSVAELDTSKQRVEDILHIVEEKGIHNALQVVDRLGDPYITDEVHRNIVTKIRSGVSIQNLKEGTPVWNLLHMTLFEIVLPEELSDSSEKSLADLAGTMEQWFIGMQTICDDKRKLHYVLEIAVAEHSDDIVFYVAIPNEYVTLFEKHTLSLFPHASLVEQQHDYNVFVSGGSHSISIAELEKHPIYPIRTHDNFSSDPFLVILNTLTKIEKNGGGAAIQFIIHPNRYKYNEVYQKIIEKVNEGEKPQDAIKRSTTTGDLLFGFGDLLFSKSKKDESERKVVDQEAVKFFTQKVETHIYSVNIRIVTSAREEQVADKIRREIESSFQQFSSPYSNSIKWKKVQGGRLKVTMKAFSFREPILKTALPLSMKELTTVIHFPSNGIQGSVQFRQSRAKTAAAPNEMPDSGTLLGVNKHRGAEKPIYITQLDRMRHFYIIGQTGTGKTTLMKNMIVQDIQDGAGVCMIDPHGTDIEDVLGTIPPEREEDLIYFDPSRTDRSIGLNMLEFDESKPEQKTFVVNEMFSIFQKLYSSNPESMGPMFEQYFRNAALLVLEDPATGNTLFDVGRVLVDSQFRALKLARAQNPVVKQFWEKMAGQAGGEASLENIVPYIVSKFDVFTGNDYMRPIIGQQKSTFNFRSIMDQRKILLVNLSKGKLGDINANMIGMIIVGKLLMAALSRVDDPTKSFAPFYLHMDEFQNVSTPSISAILSEARKYKLGLTMAHQFIAQLTPDIKDAVFGNVGSMACFRVGPEDAQFLSHQFKPTFVDNDLANVPNQNAYVKMLANGSPTRPFSLHTNAPTEVEQEWVNYLIQSSTMRYGAPREQVEAEITARYREG